MHFVTFLLAGQQIMSLWITRLSGPLSTGVLYIFATANSPQSVKQRKSPKQIELFNTLDFIKTTACDAENSLGCDSSSEHMFSVSPVWEGKANELKLHLINVFIGKLLRKMTNFFMRMQKIILQLIFLNRVHVRLQKFFADCLCRNNLAAVCSLLHSRCHFINKQKENCVHSKWRELKNFFWKTSRSVS